MIVTLNDAKYIAEELRKKKQKIVTTNGCFDVLHKGHLYLLHNARKKGRLFVGMNSDVSVRQLKPGRPVNNESDRAHILNELKPVDYVVIFNELNPNEFLKAIRPDYHVKSISGYKGLEEEVLDNWGGKLILLPDIEGYSTTGILGKLYDAHRNSGEI